MRDRSTNMWFYLHFRRKDIIALLDLGLSQAGGPGGQFLADQLTLSQPGGANYAHHITKWPPPDFQNFRWLCKVK